MSIKIALPKGRLLDETAALLDKAGLGFTAYHPKTRLYHLKSKNSPGLLGKVFQEKDIPIQVAIGNYDLGICGLDWVEELMVKYPSLAVVKVRNLGYGDGRLYMAASRSQGKPSIKELCGRTDTVRIASEYPNLAESFALSHRLRRFNIFPLWGAAEVYPPESAELALVSRQAGEPLNHDLLPLSSVLNFSAFLIANRQSWETRDLSRLVSAIEGVIEPARVPKGLLDPNTVSAKEMDKTERVSSHQDDTDIVRIALPDGHQQEATIRLLMRAGITINDYPSATGNRRPTVNLDGVTVKVIRPQDMPLQVANGNFDLAITGRDWLREHRYQFPSSPVTELFDLKSGRVRIVAVVSQELPVTDVSGLRQLGAGRSMPLRVASEYVNIADKYARENHLGMYRVVPTWGASEAFLPDDADLLIENTETGRTIASHNLKIIDTLFISTACLIGRSDSLLSARQSKIIESIKQVLSAAVEDKPVDNH